MCHQGSPDSQQLSIEINDDIADKFFLIKALISEQSPTIHFNLELNCHRKQHFKKYFSHRMLSNIPKGKNNNLKKERQSKRL